MSTHHERPHWTALMGSSGNATHTKRPALPILDDMLDEFVHFFGEQTGIELSEEKSFDNYGKITLSEHEANQLFERKHPHFTLQDFPADGAVELKPSGPQEAIFGTARLQRHLEDYFYAKLPSLMDQKKVRVSVDEKKLSSVVKKIHRTLHDYQAAGVMPKHELTRDEVAARLQLAFDDMTKFYRPHRAVATTQTNQERSR